MRVIINGLQAANRSGTGRYVQAICQALPQAAPDIDPVLVWPTGASVPELPDSVLVVRHGAGPLARLYFEQFAVRSAAVRSGASLLHYPASTGCFFPSRPIVQTVHDLCFLRHPEWFPASRNAYYRKLIAATATRANLVLADSEATARDLGDLIGISADRVRVVPLGVGSDFSPRGADEQGGVKVRYSLPESFFLYVGTLEPRKNLVRLVQAWDRVYRDGYPHLVLAGRSGWKCEPLFAALQSVRHPEAVHLPGFLSEEDLPAVLGAARAFVWPSLMEGFGLPPLEAMACGAPVLTSAVSSMPEVTGDAALLVDPINVDNIADGLSALAKDDDLCARLSAKGQRQAALFPWTRTADLTAAAYRELA